jgi:UrcA family protein
MSRLRQLAVSCIAGTGFLLMAAPALSQDNEIVILGQKLPDGHEAVRQVVKIGDLNLATAVGQTELQKRVEDALKLVCPKAEGNVPPHQRQDADACRTFAMQNAQPQIDNAIAAAKAAH